MGKKIVLFVLIMLPVLLLALYSIIFIDRHIDSTFVFYSLFILVTSFVAWFIIDKESKGELKKYYNELESRVAERALQVYKNERRFRALIENSYDIICLIDESFKIVYRSSSAERITGWTNDEMIEADGMKNIHPDNLLEGIELVQEVRLNPGKPQYCLFRSLHKDGHYVWLEGIIVNMLNDENVNAIVANYRDITNRKEAEAQLIESEKLYRNLFENMHHGFAYCKTIFEDHLLTDYTYLAVNGEYESLMGLQNVTGKNVSDIMPGFLTSNRIYKQVVSRVAITGISEKFETFVQPISKWFSIALYSPDSGYFVGLFDDITESKNAEAEVLTLNSELEQKVTKRTEELKRKNEEMEAFSYSVSHDLRAPLRAIIGFTSILEEDYTDKLDDEAKRLTSVIKNNTQKMGNLIDDLLTFSRTGKHEIETVLIDSDKMVSSVILELEQKNAVQPVKWIVGSLLPVQGDVNMIRQVWINFISNAIKYSAFESNPEIEINSYVEDDNIVFFIKDNGVGFNNAYASKLFKVFQRLHGSNEFEGSGVGLAIVEKIISRHNGSTWAESIGKGACFYFSLPSQQHNNNNKIK